MKLLIHDLTDEELKRTFKKIPDDIIFISNDNSIKKCIGCFNCWIKTPATCIIKDQYQHMGKLISQSEEIIIITKCTYGGYSPFVKNVMDRSISYIHPYFAIRNGEMHHKIRYTQQINLSVHFYGSDITTEEKNTAKKLVKGNSLNFNVKEYSINFYNNIDEIGEDILC